MKHLKILSALLLSILFASCNQGTSTSLNGGSGTNGGGGNAGAWVIPGVGTTYIYEYTSPDTTATEFDTLTVLATGQHLGGKTNVISLLDFFDGQIDTDFYNIETNGDFSFGDEENIDTLPNLIFTWDTYPTGSRQTINVETPVDTFENGAHRVTSDVRSFIGVETINVAAGTFSTLHVREITIDINSTPNDSLGNSFSDIDSSDIWFAPSAGIYVKATDNETQTGQPGQNINIQLLKFFPK